jgi:hypothetical protein
MTSYSQGTNEIIVSPGLTEVIPAFITYPYLGVLMFIDGRVNHL